MCWYFYLTPDNCLRRPKYSVTNGKKKENQRTNGPVNAHLRSATYANKHV